MSSRHAQVWDSCGGVVIRAPFHRRMKDKGMHQRSVWAGDAEATTGQPFDIVIRD